MTENILHYTEFSFPSECKNILYWEIQGLTPDSSIYFTSLKKINTEIYAHYLNKHLDEC